MSLQVVNDKYYLLKKNSVLETEKCWKILKNDEIESRGDLKSVGQEIFEDKEIQEFLLLDQYILAIENLDNSSIIYVLNNTSKNIQEINFEDDTFLEFGINLNLKETKVNLIKKSLKQPREYIQLDLESNDQTVLLQEGKMGLVKSDKILTQRYDKESDLFNIKFLFTEKRTTKDSPLIIWLSDKKDFDIYNPSLLPLLKRDFILCFVSVKDRENLNLKELISELQGMNFHFATTQPSERIGMIAEGPISGLIGLSAYLKQQSIFETAAFISPLTDIVAYMRDNPHMGDLGYGDISLEENYYEVINDSPYYSDDLKYLKNTLFLANNHAIGYHSLKLYAKAQNLFAKNSNNFYRYLDHSGEEDVIWMTYFIKNFYLKNRKKKFKFNKESEED